MCRVEKGYLYQYLPHEFDYLCKDKIIEYKGYKLKTDYLINIINELLLKFYNSNEESYNLWSTILKRNYGKTYNIYIDYLVENKFMNFTSDYYVGKKAKTYKLNITTLDVGRCKITDKTLLKKHQRDYLFRRFTEKQESPIKLNLRKILVDDLYHVNLDYDMAFNWLNEQKEKGIIDISQYYKNLRAIDDIEIDNIFFSFDSYGRLHTNFTVLKKYIRENYLTIDDENIHEQDVKNSQPFFFAVLLKDEISTDNFNAEIWKYVDCVKNGLIYDEIQQSFPKKVTSRENAKTLMYKVLFGNNKDNKVENNIFKKLYPTVYDHILDYKYFSNSYKSLSHKLQKLESNFIFGNVVTEIKEKFPDIKLFTVHDSICYPIKNKEEIGIIFRKHFNNLL